MKDAIGQAAPRKEDLRLIAGRGTYVSDLRLPRTKHGVPITHRSLWELMQQEPTQ